MKEWKEDIRYIYIMKNDLGLYKIGVSTLPNRRRSEIERASGVRTRVIFSSIVKHALRYERMLHNHFRKNRTHGEWFSNLNVEMVENKLNEIIMCETNTELL